MIPNPLTDFESVVLAVCPAFPVFFWLSCSRRFVLVLRLSVMGYGILVATHLAVKGWAF
jgi:hypothetical protein